MTTVAPPQALPRLRDRRWRPGLVLAAAFLVALLLAVAWPRLFTGIDPNAADIRQTLAGPSGHHWLGTDQNGRDVYARIVAGARVSLFIGLTASALALAAGSALGVLAAAPGAASRQGPAPRLGRAVSAVVDRLLDVFLSIPGLLLALLVIAVLGPGTWHSTIGLGVILTPGFARLVRGEVIRIRGSVYVEAARALGWPRWQVALRHILPNAVGPVLVLATIGIGAAISTGSSLAFLGLGPHAPTAEWGAMLSTSRDYIAVAWWPAVFPGIAITLTVLAVTVVGRYLQLRVEGREPR